MYTPDFQNVEDVQRFLRYGGDAWCRPMVEEYMELVGLAYLEATRKVI